MDDTDTVTIILILFYIWIRVWRIRMKHHVRVNKFADAKLKKYLEKVFNHAKFIQKPSKVKQSGCSVFHYGRDAKA
jgi:hypothetical protein